MLSRIKKWLNPAVETPKPKLEPDAEFYHARFRYFFDSAVADHQNLIRQYNWLHTLLIAAITSDNGDCIFVDYDEIDKAYAGKYKLVITKYDGESYRIRAQELNDPF